MTDTTSLPPSVDGKLALAAELDLLSAQLPVAAQAPRGTGIARYLGNGINEETLAGEEDGPFWALTVHLIQRLGIWWSPSSFAVMPVMTPWCIRDRSARYDQGPESWGAPRDDGLLRDDNSIIKKLPQPLTISAPANIAYHGRKPRRGFTACHIWRDLEDGGIGGADQWIYSNMANLVWLPSPIMSLTDHHPRVQALLRRTSQRMFRGNEGTTTRRYAEYAWNRMIPDGALVEDGPTLDIGRAAQFMAPASFYNRRLRTIDGFIRGADEVLADGAPSRKINCTRYTEGIVHLEHAALAAFRDELVEYAAAVRAGLRSRLATP